MTLSLRFIFMIVYTPAACALALMRPFYGLLALVGMYYFRPTIWHAPGWFRPILWITICVGVGWLLRIKSFRFSGLMSLAVLTLFMALVSAMLVAKDTDLAIGCVWTMTKVIIVGFLTLQLVDTEAKINMFLWTNVLGMLWNIKTILVLGLLGAGVTQDVRVDVGVGQGGGSNYLAMILVMTLPFFFVKVLGGTKWEVRFSILAAPVYVLCVVLTGSRGGFLSLFVTALYVVMRSNRKLIGTAALVIAAAIFFVTVPDTQMDRFKQGFAEGEKRDFAATSRILLWKAAWTMFQEDPVLGKGPDNFQRLSPRYAGFYAGDVHTKYEEGQSGRGFVAHSTWFQVLAEGGMAMTVPFLAMFVLAFLSLWKVRQMPFRNPVTRRRLYYHSIALEGLWVAFISASSFGSHIKIDFLWWYMGLTSALLLVAEEALRREQLSMREEAMPRLRSMSRPITTGTRR